MSQLVGDLFLLVGPDISIRRPDSERIWGRGLEPQVAPADGPTVKTRHSDTRLFTAICPHQRAVTCQNLIVGAEKMAFYFAIRERCCLA